MLGCTHIPEAALPEEQLCRMGEEAAKSPTKPSPEPTAPLVSQGDWEWVSKPLSGEAACWQGQRQRQLSDTEQRCQSPAASYPQGAGKRPDSAASLVAAGQKHWAHGVGRQNRGTRARGATGDHRVLLGPTERIWSGLAAKHHPQSRRSDVECQLQPGLQREERKGEVKVPKLRETPSQGPAAAPCEAAKRGNAASLPGAGPVPQFPGK